MTCINLATFVGLFVCLIQLADSNPYNNQRYSGHSFSSRSGPNGNGIAYSGSSYHSLGIQATAQQQPQQGRSNNEQYWWQGSQSPFSETAAQNRGVSSGARAIDTSRAHARPLVPGCGGGKCFGAAGHSAVASSHSNSNGQQNYVSQQYLPPTAASSSHSAQVPHQSQNFGGAASQGQSSNVAPFPGCAAAMKCVTEEFCSVDGVMVNTPVRLSPYEKEHLRVPLMECTNSETNQVGFCCRDPLYEDPWPADMPMPGMTKLPTQPGGASLNRPVVSAPAVSSINSIPSVSSFNNGQSNVNRPAVAVTAAVSTGSNGRPVSSVGAAASSFNQASPAQHGQPSQHYGPPSGTPSQRPFNQQPAGQAQRPATAYQPPTPTYQASQSQQQTNTLQGPPAPPFAGCAAAMKCVTEEYCSVEGVMVNTPVRLSPYEKEYLRVPLMECTNPDTYQVGFCCRDPLYEDPWPAGMPMPGMTKVPTQTGGASLNRPVVSASVAAVSTNNGRPSVSSFNNGQSNGNRPTVTATAAGSSSSNGRPVVGQGAAVSFNQQGQQTNQYVIPTSPGPTPRPVSPQVASASYQPPSQSYLPPPAQKPATPPHTASGFKPARPAYQQPAPSSHQPAYQASQSQTNTASILQGPPGSSFPGCAAAMKCVTEEFCSVDGVMVNTPVRLSPYEKEYLRVPLMACLNKDTNQEGFCCRDPLYNDPWPAGMPMP
ncbi:hypothetical protein OUZ56_006549 [Daphnia magna]|uniref:Inactive serine protease scarface clip-domain domain-containing protein n=1 Tax=Daphnia magna TaxID=35525 RepID=A0ABQ9YW50_9CRUS|nr:hypothetical protein OUZ56_006549 [Daphnia magna]